MVSNVNGRFTITSQKVLELQHRVETTKDTFGFGVGSNFSQVNVLADAQIWRTT